MTEPRGTALSRRDWLRGVGAGGAALALGCGDDVAPGAFDLGAAVLEPSSDALLVSVWAAHAREVTLELRSPGTLRTATVPIGPAGTAALDLVDLPAGTGHELTIQAGELRRGPFYASTAPRDDDPRPLRLAITADIDPNPEFETDLADHVVLARPDLLVTLGDFPYTDNGPPAIELDAYRARHAEARVMPQVRALLQAMPLRAIYDDHEFRNDWDARFAAELPERHAAAMTAWDEFFPQRAPAGAVRYRSWRWGAHAECWLLDCRRFRSANAAPDDAAKTMLGATQRAWLLDGLARSTATFKLVFTSVPLDFGHGTDHWNGFRTERQALFDAFAGVRGLVCFSADQHWFAAHRHAGGLREFQVGPFARGIIEPPPPAPGVLFRALEYNAGLVDIDGDRLTVTALGPGGARLYQETLTADDLTPRRA